MLPWPLARSTSSSSDARRRQHDVIAGHHTHFGFLQQLQRDDRLELQDAQGRWHRYDLSASHIVDSREGKGGQGELHLMTCYPFDAVVPGGSLRYVVVAHKIEAAEEPGQLALEGLNAGDKNRHNERL